MKKQIILDEQDIKEFHEDAEHLRWLYNRKRKKALGGLMNPNIK